MKTMRLILWGLLLTVTTAAEAQIVQELTDSVVSATRKKSAKDMAQTVQGAFAAKAASAEMMVGTWVYAEPAVLVTSGNLLYKAVGDVTVGTLEKLLGQYIEKGNINQQNTSITFYENGTFVRTMAGQKARGVWMMDGEKLLLAVKNVQTASLTTHVDGDQVLILADAAKIMNVMKAMGTLPDNATVKGLAKLSKSLKGIEGGFALVRKK